MDMRPEDRRERTEVSESGETRVEEDYVASRENQIWRINGIVWFILGVIEAFIGVRVILKLLAADPANGFASFIYRVSHLFLAPFFGLVGQPTANGSVLEASSIIAMLVYLLVAWGVTRLVYLIMMPARVRHLRTIQRH